MNEISKEISSTQAEVSAEKSGGSLTIEQKSDLVADTVGQLLAIPRVHIPLLTIKDIFKRPSEELKEQLKERWKDVPEGGCDGAYRPYEPLG